MLLSLQDIKKMLKRILPILTALMLTLSLWGCSFKHFMGVYVDIPENPSTISQENLPKNNISSSTDNETFSQYLTELFAELLKEDMISLHSFVEDPEKFGVKDYKVTLGSYDLDNLDQTSEFNKYLTRLNSFDRSTLSTKQQLTYDELVQMFTTELNYSDLYLFASNLSRTIGLQVELPILFAEYTFSNEKDVKEYLTLLSDTDRFIQNIIDYEKKRSQNGLFMEDVIVDEIVEQCKTFLESAQKKDNVLVQTFNERIDALSNISDSSKNEYKEQNVKAINDHVVKGYELLIDGLNSLKGTSKYTGGLCNAPNGNGKKYYEYLLNSSLGWNKNVDEYESLVDKYLNKYMMNMSTIIMSDNSLYDKFENFKFSITEPEKTLPDLKKKLTKDFPEIPDVKYDVKNISSALSDYASPAMYFLPQLDNLSVNSIYVNPSSITDDNVYSTMAHEGYPGHMYQTQYFASTNPDAIRFILSPGGYVEGYATYIEQYAYEYDDSKNPNLNKLMNYNYSTVLCLYAKVDIGVNYKGWTENDVYKFISNYGFSDKDVAKEMYLSMVSEPGNYCKYLIGKIAFEELKATAENELGGSFDLKEFHKFILDIGPIQFSILEDRLKPWIAQQKNKTV